jgi:medium-chain acyl-[acyl-carrier-protein] hydrolase
MRLLCLPYAGSGAAPFRPWARLLPAEIELSIVQLPGRETRLREAPFTDMPSLIASIVPALEPALDLPFALFGHSMGALVAFELARELQRRDTAPLVHLFASGRRAPHLVDPDPPLAGLADGEFVREIVRRYNAIPQVILDDADMLRIFLPTLRADLGMLEGYRFVDARPMDCPITAFSGTDDPRATRTELVAWQNHTTRTFQARQLPGDHFYLHPQREALVAQLVSLLADWR